MLVLGEAEQARLLRKKHFEEFLFLLAWNFVEVQVRTVIVMSMR